MSRSRFSPQLLATLGGLPPLDGYRNTRTVLTISGRELTVVDLLKGAVVANLPTLLVSGTGDAKTLLAKEVIARWFGGRATVLRGDGGEPPVKAFLRTSFERLFRREASSDEELIEATQRMGFSLVFIDELNRGVIATLQNDLLSIVDGEINYRGKVFRIGDGFCPVIAAMNLGDEYAAAHVLDDALLRRFPVVLDLDRFGPTLDDYALIDPHPQRPPQESWLTEIKEAHEELRLHDEPETGFKLASQYVLQHLNRCALLGKNKRQLVKAIPSLCESHNCPHMERQCHTVRTIPPATALGLVRVARVFQAVAEAQARHALEASAASSIEQQLADYLECFRVFLPLWNKLLLKEEEAVNSDEHAARIVAYITESFEKRSSAIVEVVTGGEDIDRADLGEWRPVVASLLQANRRPLRQVS